MKSIFKLSALLGVAALLLSVVSCQQEELDTAHYADGKVTLASFGPNPVMRGAQLRFFGSNLEQIESVEVPGIGAIRNIEVVSSGKISEIRITLPVEGPEVGYVTLVSNDGKKFKTVSELTYTEPIVFDSFTANEKAYPGDVITLKGDYMNLVESVTFEGGEKVLVNEGATRHEAQVVVPANALTGKIVLSDGATVENLFYSEEVLVMGEPTVKANAKATLKAGDEITVAGEHLEMIEYFKIGDIVIDTFTLAEDNSSIALNLPEKASDGKLNAVAYSGAEYAAAEIVTLVPVVSSVSPKPVKAGKNLTIAGKDLDLVTKVSFEGVEEATFSYADGKITVAVAPEVKEGKVVLTLANGKTVETSVVLVHPTISSVSPAELYAGDETPVVVKGKDLDLAVKAAIGGKEVEISSSSETEIKLATTPSSVSGKVTLTLANGETVESAEAVTMKYHSKVIVKSIPASQHIGQEVVIEGEHLNLVENIFIGTTKVTDYSIRKDDEIRFLMPWCKVGSYDVNFLLFDGDTETQANQITVELEQIIDTIWEGNHAPGNWGAGMQALAWGGFDWTTVKPGTELVVFYVDDPKKEYGPNIRLGNGSWNALPSTKVKYADVCDGDGNITPSAGSTYISITLTADDLYQLQEKGGLVVCGAWFIVQKIQLITDIPQEKTLFEGSAVVNWNNAVTIPASTVKDWTPGMVLTVTYEVTPADYHMIRIINNDWSFNPDGDSNYNWNFGESGSFTKTVDQELLDKLGGKDMSLTGFGCNITKVTIL